MIWILDRLLSLLENKPEHPYTLDSCTQRVTAAHLWAREAGKSPVQFANDCDVLVESLESSMHIPYEANQ
jgi:hypothetical protein